MRPSPVPLVNLLRNEKAFCPHKLHDSTVGITHAAPPRRPTAGGMRSAECSAARHAYRAVGLAAILKHLLGTKGAGVCSRPKGA